MFQLQENQQFQPRINDEKISPTQLKHGKLIVFSAHLIVTLVTRALCFVFDCYVSDSHTLFCIWLLR